MEVLEPRHLLSGAPPQILSAGPLPDEGAAVTDLIERGQALDGNGDGTAGDDFVRRFSVADSPGFVLEKENNNTYTYATPLDVLEEPVASGYHVGYALGTLATTADVDYWWFDAQAGDRVAVAVDTPDSNLDPWVDLRTVSDGQLTYENNAGPGTDALIPSYTISTAGRYLVRVASQSGTGNYALRVDVARGNLQLEQDASYANDGVGSANALTKQVSGQTLTASVAGTIMATESDNPDGDQDYFALGPWNAGNQIQLGLRLPSGSRLDGRVKVVDASGTAVTDADGNLTDADFQGTLPAGGDYYAVVEANAGAGPRGQYLLDVTITGAEKGQKRGRTSFSGTFAGHA